MYGNSPLAKVTIFRVEGRAVFFGGWKQALFRVSKMADPRTTSSEGLSFVYRDMFRLERSENQTFGRSLSARDWFDRGLAVFGNVVWQIQKLREGNSKIVFNKILPSFFGS